MSQEPKRKQPTRVTEELKRLIWRLRGDPSVKTLERIEEELGNLWPELPAETKLGAIKPPHRNTIQRYTREFDTRPDRDKKAYRLVHWPGSMERGDLPWEASASTLEILAFTRADKRSRPRVGLTECFWRVTQAVPEASLMFRFKMAMVMETLAILEYPSAEEFEQAMASVAYLRYEPDDDKRHRAMAGLELRASNWVTFEAFQSPKAKGRPITEDDRDDARRRRDMTPEQRRQEAQSLVQAAEEKRRTDAELRRDWKRLKAEREANEKGGTDAS